MKALPIPDDYPPIRIKSLYLSLHNLIRIGQMKRTLLFIAVAMFAYANGNAQEAGNDVTRVILSGYSEREFSTEAVTDPQIELILQCGIKAPSGRNLQPWKFTVIRDEATMKEAINNVVAGNVLIVVSGKVAENGSTPDFDCGLATESMFVAAHSLGLGARIYASPTGNINDKRDLFQIPEGYKALAVLRVGKVDKSVDAVTAATPRKSAEEIVNFKR
jgi:nitroreductase